MRLNIFLILLISLVALIAGTACGKENSIQTESDLCHRLSLNKGSEEIYAEYIEKFLLSGDKFKECVGEDQVLSQINDFLKLHRGKLSANEFAKRQYAAHNDILSLWYIDNLIVRNKPIYEKWINQYKCSYANCILNKIGNIEALKDNYAFEYYLQLLKKSDGEYAENISSRIISIFYEHPDFIMSNITKLVKVEKELVSLFCYILPTKERNKLEAIYMEYPPDKAAKVLNWLSCK